MWFGEIFIVDWMSNCWFLKDSTKKWEINLFFSFYVDTSARPKCCWETRILESIYNDQLVLTGSYRTKAVLSTADKRRHRQLASKIHDGSRMSIAIHLSLKVEIALSVNQIAAAVVGRKSINCNTWAKLGVVSCMIRAYTAVKKSNNNSCKMKILQSLQKKMLILECFVL